MFRDRTLGVLALFLRTRFTAADRDRLRTLANHAAASLETARAFDEIDRLRAQLAARSEYLQEDAQGEAAPAGFVGSSAAAERVRQQVALVAPTDATVLITGESGTGKEVVARGIHAASARARGADDPRELRRDAARALRERVLRPRARRVLGRDGRPDRALRGAPTAGRSSSTRSREIPPELQAKLLRVLQDGEYVRVGESAPRRVDVRIVAATNQDLDAARRAGRFREDLYYRLDVFPIAVPPLRERREDVGELARHFLAPRGAGRRAPRLAAEDVVRLEAYAWPGNVRELQNVVARALIVSGPAGPLRIALPDDPPRLAAAAPRGADERVYTERELLDLERGEPRARARAHRRPRPRPARRGAPPRRAADDAALAHAAPRARAAARGRGAPATA